MARPWEYPRWRRVLMQVVMWLVFAGSLGLAQLVAHRRGLDFGRSVLAGSFVVRLPAEFKVGPAVPGFDLVADDWIGKRRLFVLSRPFDPDGQGLSPTDDLEMPVDFRGLHVRGVMEIRRIPNTARGEDAFDYTIQASARLPRSSTEIVVGMELGEGEPDAADQSLLRDVAGSIVLARTGPRVPTNQRSGGRDVGQSMVSAWPRHEF